MLQDQPLTGTPAVRAGEPQTTPSRPGRVPQGAHPLARLCILSLSTPGGASAEADLAALAADMRRLADLGLGVGLALEPSERARLGAEQQARLVRHAGTLALPQGFVAGAGCEHLFGATSIGDQLEALVEQASAIEEAGGVPVLLPLAALARRRASENEYVEVYRALLARIGGPVLLDWTGTRQRPELFDYFPGRSFERVMALEPAKVRGARFALLDVARETRLRRELLARDQLLFTADRANLAHLLLGANPGPAPVRVPEPARFTELAGLPIALGDFSHAMLSAASVPAATLAAALKCLEAGDAPGLVARLA